MTGSVDSAEKILDQALALASQESWEDLRLVQVAKSLDLGLDDIRRHYRSKDELAEALFDRADRAMLKACSGADFHALCGRERLVRAIMAWLDVLAPHRRTVIGIFKYKLEPGHVHLQAEGITRISRTVQWILEATGSQSSGPGKIMEEFGTTSVYLATVAIWLTDRSPDSARTRAFVEKRLREASAVAARINPNALVNQTVEQIEQAEA